MLTSFRPPFPRSATVMRYRTSRPQKAFNTVAGGLLLFGIGAGIYSHYYRNLSYRDVFGPEAILAGLLVLVNLQQLGYRAGWDETAIYVRRWGIFNALNLKSEITKVPWEKILGFTTSLRTVFGRDWDYEPDEFLEIDFGRAAKDRIRVYPYMIDMQDFEEFARVFSTKLDKSIELE